MCYARKNIPWVTFLNYEKSDLLSLVSVSPVTMHHSNDIFKVKAQIHQIFSNFLPQIVNEAKPAKKLTLVANEFGQKWSVIMSAFLPNIWSVFLLMFGKRCSYLDKCTHVTDMTSSRGLKSQANASMLRGIGRSRSARFYIFESTSEKKSYKHTFCQCNSKMTLTRIEWQSVKNPVTF